MKNCEKKVNITEKEGVELSDEQLSKVSGGRLDKIDEEIRNGGGDSAE